MLVGTDPRPAREPDDYREAHLPARSVAKSAEMTDDLVEGGIDEPVELDLGDGTGTGNGHPDGGPDDPGFVERSVYDPVIAKALVKPFGDSENPARDADVFSQAESSLGESPSHRSRLH